MFAGILLYYKPFREEPSFGSEAVERCSFFAIFHVCLCCCFLSGILLIIGKISMWPQTQRILAEALVTGLRTVPILECATN